VETTALLRYEEEGLMFEDPDFQAVNSSIFMLDYPHEQQAAHQFAAVAPSDFGENGDGVDPSCDNGDGEEEGEEEFTDSDEAQVSEGQVEVFDSATCDTQETQNNNNNNSGEKQGFDLELSSLKTRSQKTPTPPPLPLVPPSPRETSSVKTLHSNTSIFIRSVRSDTSTGDSSASGTDRKHAYKADAGGDDDDDTHMAAGEPIALWCRPEAIAPPHLQREQGRLSLKMLSSSLYTALGRAVLLQQQEQMAQGQSRRQRRRQQRAFDKQAQLERYEQHQQLARELLADAEDARDPIQGDIGDCWLLSALSLVASRPELAKEIVKPSPGNVAGLYRVSV
jgi:hypothetical protein